MRNKMFLFSVATFIVTVAEGQLTNFNKYSHNTAMDGSFNSNGLEHVKGSRYLFNGWAKGNAITSKGDVINNDSIFYNLDKINQSLLVTEDKKEIMAVDRSDLASFTLSDGSQTYHFERVDAIDPKGFLQVLEKKDNGYTLYKSIQTNFEQANYQTNGLSESGHKDDEYIDKYKYFIVMPDGKSFKEVTLKSKSIKEAVGNDPKTAQFLSEHKSDSIDETFLKGLIQFLNQ